MKNRIRSNAELDKLPDRALMSKQEAANWMHSSIWTVNRLIDQRLLRATQIETQWRTCKLWIDEYLRLRANALSVVPNKRAM